MYNDQFSMYNVQRLMRHPMLLFLLCAVGFTWAVQHDPFFWDTIQLASKHAHFFYGNNGAWEILPPDIDSGHPPVLGYYLAALWHIFGKNLATGHWGMLPFLCSIIWLLYRLGKRLGGTIWAWWLLPLVLLDPVLLGQSAMVSPDTMLAAFFLCAVEGALGRNKLLITIGIAGLCAISMRGMMCTGALFIALLLYDRKALQHNLLAAFLPGFSIAAAFLLWHWQAAGWIGYHAGSPWAPAFSAAGFTEMMRNVAILGWRWLDFGRIAEWIAVAVLLWYGKKHFWDNRIQSRPFESMLFLLLVCHFVLLSISAIRYHNLSAHRYFLPVFLLFHLFVFQWVVKTLTLRPIFKKGILTALSVSLALGNFQVYPHGISMDWDSTLAHLPYHAVRADAVVFLQQRQIPLSEVGTAFPGLNTGENIQLDGDQATFAAIDTHSNAYIFISNVFNDVSKEQRLDYRRNWRLIWHQERGPVWGEIYAKSDTPR